MDLEKNNLNVDNEEGLLDADEINKSQQGEEVFDAGQESFLTNEENINNPEENDLTSSKKNETKDQDELTKASQASSAVSISVPGVIISLVTSIGIIGGTVGLIPTIPSNNVSVFLSRSTELGFEIDKDLSKTYLLTLSNNEYDSEEEVTLRNQYVFEDLSPNTVYYLKVFDTSVEPMKKVYSASYLTKEIDKYFAYVSDQILNEGVLSFDVDYAGENIGYVTVEVLGDQGNSLYFYEGQPQEEYSAYVGENVNVTCRISINGEMTGFAQLLNPDDTITPVGDWLSDENNHWHEVNGEIKDLSAHEFEQEILQESTFEEVGSAKKICSICGYETAPYELPLKEHNYSNAWSKDETHHWHACLDAGYEQLTSDYQEHDYHETAHADATYDTIGYTIYTCSVCEDSYEETFPVLEHQYSDEWESDEWTHWHPCLDEGYEDLKGSEETHSFDIHGECLCGLSGFEFELDEEDDTYKLTGYQTSVSMSFETLEFPETYNDKPVTDIAYRLFPNGGVVNATVPNSYTHISDSAFYACSEMETLVLPFVGSNANHTSVNEESFFGWIFGTSGYGGSAYWVDMSTYGGARTLIPSSLTSITINGGKMLDYCMAGLNKVEQIVINNVTEIGSYAFAEYGDSAAIQSITLDHSVTSIGDYAFANNPLQELTFNGTMEEWEAISVSASWKDNSSLTIVHCTDGNIPLV